MNTLSATITAITASEHLSAIRVSVNEDEFHLLLAEASDEEHLIHTPVTLVFKETEVILAKGIGHSTANVQKGVVRTIEKGIILSQVTFAYHGTEITALVPTPTFDTLGITEGDEILWMVSPSEISLLRGHNGI